MPVLRRVRYSSPDSSGLIQAAASRDRHPAGGGSFTGDSVVPYTGCLACEDGRLHFAGKSNREAVVAAINQLGFGSATELVVSGCSAGAAAAFIHTDWWHEQVPGAKTRGMPSSGWFYEGEYTRDGKDNYKSLMTNLFTFMNSSSGLSSKSGKACLAAGRNSSCCVEAIVGSVNAFGLLGRTPPEPIAVRPVLQDAVVAALVVRRCGQAARSVTVD